MLKENERKYQDELRKKYNVDNIFQKTNQLKQTIISNNTNDENINDIAIVEYKKSVFQKLVSKIKNFFNIN